MHRFFDPLGGLSWKVAGYAWLGVFFLRLAAWHAIEGRYGRA